MSLITPSELRDNLILQGIPSEDLDDYDALQKLIELKVTEIIGLTGLPIRPVARKQIITQFHDETFQTEWYPVSEIHSFKINGKTLTDDDYDLDEMAGIIYLNSVHTGRLVIEYIHRLSGETIAGKINPLISDMIMYHFKDDGKALTGEVTAIREMDTSVNYDTSNSLGGRIYSRIESLKQEHNNYSAKIKWL